MHQDIAEKLSEISSKIQAACHQAQRSEEEIRLIAVSKLQSIDVINEAYALGINNFVFSSFLFASIRTENFFVQKTFIRGPILTS